VEQLQGVTAVGGDLPKRGEDARIARKMVAPGLKPKNSGEGAGEMRRYPRLKPEAILGQRL